MLDMEPGDLVIWPKAPDYDHFTIAEVEDKYWFKGHDDFGHIIPVKNMLQVNNWNGKDALMIFEMMKSAYFRPPVTKVQDYNTHDLLSAYNNLRQQDDTTGTKDPSGIKEQIYQESRRKAAEELIKSSRKWGFQVFEDIVGMAFKDKGYKQISRNSYDGAGGDADYVFSMPMPGFAEEALSTVPVLLMIVQIKHKEDVDYGDVAGVDQLVNFAPGRGRGALQGAI